jgi:hypothetical protein
MVTGELNEETEENSLGNLRIFAVCASFRCASNARPCRGTPFSLHSIKKSKHRLNNQFA